MNNSMKSLLTELRKYVVDVATVVTYLDLDDNVTTYGLDSFKNLLSDYKEPTLSRELSEYLIKIVETTIEEDKAKREREMNELIVKNSFSHYHEVFTSNVDFEGDPSVITTYEGKEKSDTLEYYAFHPSLQECSFMIGTLLFVVSPIDEISFTQRDGTMKTVTYKYHILITNPFDPARIRNDFKNFKLESLYGVLGMSFLCDQETVSISLEDDRTIMRLNTQPFYLELAKKYNSYYSNLMSSEGHRFDEIKGIEKCQVDTNGLILVPKLFLISSYLIDGDLEERPLVLNDDQGFEPVDLRQNQYRISINYEKTISDADANSAIAMLISEMEKSGVTLKSSPIAKNVSSNTVILQIEGYDRAIDPVSQSSISKRLSAEKKVSDSFKKLCRDNMIGVTDFNVKSAIAAGNEKYSFFFDKSRESGFIRASFNRSESKFMVFFNRSVYTINRSPHKDSSDFVKVIDDTNNAKFNYASQMLSNSQRMLSFNGKRYQDTYSNYLPISFIPISFKKGEGRDSNKKMVDYIGLSFIPFGFARYNSVDMNRSLSKTAFAIYGSEFSMTPLRVNRVLRLSNDPTDVSNIVQVVIRSSDVPIFRPEFDLPLQLRRINKSHHIALFRSTAHNFAIENECVWFYASDYVYNSDDASSVSENDIMTLNLTFKKLDSFTLSKSSLLRFYIETIALHNNFKRVLIDNSPFLVGDDDMVSLTSIFRDHFASGNIRVDGVPKYFFELIAKVCENGAPSDNILDLVYVITLSQINKESFTDGDIDSEFVFLKSKLDATFEMVKIFIKSIQSPIKSVDYPVFSSDMQLSIRTKFLDEIKLVSEKLYSIVSELCDKDSVEINSVATGHSGIMRRVILLISDSFMELPDFRNGSKITSIQLKELREKIIGELTNDASTLLFPHLVGQSVNPKFVQMAASTLTPELFSKLINEIYLEITADSYAEEIKFRLELFFDEGSSFSITPLSVDSYNVSFKKENEEIVKSLDGVFIRKIARTIEVKDLNKEVLQFGSYTYDPNIHCMFKVSYEKGSDLTTVIKQAFSSNHIYYVRVGDCQSINDLNIVSIYNARDQFESGDILTSRFFLPYIHNNGKLAVRSCNWELGESLYNLESKTCEIVVDFYKCEETDFTTISKNLFCSQALTIDPANLSFLRSICLGLEPIRKPYTIENRLSHYIFSDNIKDSFRSDTYSSPSDIIPLEKWEEISVNEESSVNITIHPIPLLIPKLYIKENLGSFINSVKFFLSNYGKSLRLPNKSAVTLTSSFVSSFIDTYTDSFIEPYEKTTSSFDEVMIISNKSGVYSKYYGSRSLESTFASGENEYSNYLTEINFDGLDELTNIDRLILKEKIDLENKIRHSGNIIHNLSLATNNIKWDSVKIDNHRFYSEEKPKWIKFSKDSYFMGIGFQSGVKIYIKAGAKYVFCNNLNHEGVKDIVFGNKEFCITTQYEDSTREFSILWVTTAGVKINISLPYYNLVKGDAVNIKYITGTTSKEKKNVILDVNSDGVMKFGTFTIQYAEPIFDHNVYFFSPDDHYLIHNKKGKFVIYDLHKIERVKYSTINGVPVGDKTSFPKCIEDGNWINDKTFIGFTYANGRPLVKNQIIIRVDKLSVMEIPVLPEFPTSTLFESMKTEKSIKVHPLYSYLMNYREKYGGIKQYGRWIYNCFVSLEMVDDQYYITTTTLDGSYMCTPIEVDQSEVLESDFEINNFLNSIIQQFEFQIHSGTHIYSINWNNTLIFDREFSSRLDVTHDQIVKGETKLQYINGNFFAFSGNSVYVWNYDNDNTEIVHIDINGYEKFIFSGKLIVFVSDVVKVCIIRDGFMDLRDLETTETIEFDKKPTDITKIVKPVSESFNQYVIASTQTCIENYGDDSDSNIPINVDSKIISSNLCMNRSESYTLKTHVLAKIGNTNVKKVGGPNVSGDEDQVVTSYDNLLIIVNGREVKIIPKTIQCPTKIDGFNMPWYNSHADENWEGQKQDLIRYIQRCLLLIPNINSDRAISFDMEPINRIFKDRTDANVEDGFVKLRNEGALPEVINAFKVNYKVIGGIRGIISKNSMFDAIREYESGISGTENRINKYLNTFKPSERNNAYDKLLEDIAPIFGRVFFSSEIVEAFVKIREVQLNNVNGTKVGRTTAQVKEFFAKQQLQTDRERRIVSIINHVMDIPIKDLKLPHINTIVNFKGRLSSLRDEISRIDLMLCKVSKYDLFKTMETTKLEEKYVLYMKRSIAMRSRSTIHQTVPDFVIYLKPIYERISELPKDLVLIDNEGFDDNHKYIKRSRSYFRISKYDLEVLQKQSPNELKYDLEVLDMRDSMEFAIDILKKYLEETISTPKLGLNATLNLNEFAIMLDRRKIDEKDVFKNQQVFRLQAYLQSKKDDLSVDTMNRVKDEIGKYVDLILKYRNEPYTIKEFFDLITEINAIRFPTEGESDDDDVIDYVDSILKSINTELPEDANDDILKWNIEHVRNTFNNLRNFIIRGYSVPDGTYNETYNEVSNRLRPLLKKYRNGNTEPRKTPVTAIKLLFPRKVRHLKSSEYGQNESKDIFFEYSIPEKDALFGISNGVVKINLVDVIMKFTDKSLDYDTTNILSSVSVLSHYDDVIDTFKSFDEYFGTSDGLKVTKSILPSVNNLAAIQDFETLREAFNLKYKYVQLSNERRSTINYDTEKLVKDFSLTAQCAVSDIVINYNFDYVTSGVDFGDSEYPMIYTSKRSEYTNSSISESMNISFGAIKPIEHDPKFVTRKGSYVTFQKDNSEFIVFYGNMMGDGKTVGFIGLQDLMTREVSIYHYIKLDKRGVGISSYIVNIIVEDNGRIELEEKIEDQSYEKGKGRVSVLVSDKTFFSSFSNLLNKMTLVDGLIYDKYQEAVCTGFSVKVCGNLHAIVTRYKAGFQYGSVAEIYETNGDIIEKVNSWHFHMFDIKAFDLTKKSLFLLGSINGANGNIAKMGVMNIKEKTQSKPVFVKVFDREIKLASANAEIMSNCSVIAGKTTYVTFKSKHLNHLVIVNEKRHYETRNINDITSVSVSRESGYIGIYFKNLGISEVWTCNGQLSEVVDGECNWM